MDAVNGYAVPDRALLELLADAKAVQQLVLASPGLTMNQIAANAGRCRTQLTRLLRLSWLSPRIVEAIAGGTQPRSLTRKVLMASSLPFDWAEQERALGIPA
jgi:site-specific DNA recombinase